jgi:hypothetical protein
VANNKLFPFHIGVSVFFGLLFNGGWGVGVHMDFCNANISACGKTNSQGLLRLILTPLFITLFLFSPSSLAMTPEKVMVYFYSSETNINNFKSLKMGFDHYLTDYGDYEFQPFEDRTIFDQHVKGKAKCILLLSSWHFRNISRTCHLRSVLIGLRNGKKYQQRILVVRRTTPNIESLEGGHIASSSSVQHTKSVLMEMVKKDAAKIKARILAVPKDIDALMAVGFGISKAALTTRNAFEELKTINPTLYKNLKILAEGQQSHLLILAVPKAFVENADHLVNVVKNMSKNSDGKKKMRMLGLDGWQEPDFSDRKQLEAP